MPMPFVSCAKKNKNKNREKKINQKVAILESKLLANIDKYSQGIPVDIAIDSLGNEYVFVYIGESTYWANGEYDAISGSKNWMSNKARQNNVKTDDIFQLLYSRMQNYGYVLCKHGGVGFEGVARFGIEGWVLVKENTPVPETVSEDATEDATEEKVNTTLTTEINETFTKALEE